MTGTSSSSGTIEPPRGPRLVPAPLVGRERELHQLSDLLADAGRGDGCHVLVEGEAGIGKSRLLRELGAIARRNGFDTLTATGDPLATAVAFGAALELIGPLAAATGAARERLFADAAALALPLLEPAGEAAPADAQPLVHGLFRLLANAAAARPLLLLVDDLQWLDRGSLHLLSHLAARAHDLPLLLVAALRSGEPVVDRSVVDRFRSEPAAVVVTLGPLSATALAPIAAAAGLADPSAALLADCATATGGNPLLATALLRDLAVRDTAAGSTEAPASAQLGAVGELRGIAAVARAVEVRLGRLEPLAGEFARLASVLGDGASLGQVARLAGVDLDRAAAAADLLIASGLLATAEPISFAHPLVRASLHDHVPATRRARLHAAAARQLEADRADVERVAAHLLRALPARDEQAVELLQAAAAQASARGVPESAIGYLERALAEPPAEWQEPGVLVQLGTAQAAAGRADAVETLQRALKRIDAPRQRAGALLLLGRARFANGTLREAAEAFEQGLGTLEQLPADASSDPSLRELKSEMGAGFISAARFDADLRPEAQRRLTPLLATVSDGTTRGERALLAEVALEQGIRCAPPETAIALAMRAWADGRILDELDPQGIVLSQIAATLTWSDAFEQSEVVLSAAVAHAERRGTPHQLATAAYLRAWPRYYRGDLAAAKADALRALATPDWAMYEPSARAIVALVALERGDVGTVQEALDVPDAAERWAGSIPYAMLLEASGRALMVRGEAAAAAEAFARCGTLISAMETGHPFCPWRSQRALALARDGDRDTARELAAEELRLARALGLARPLGGALRAAALVAEDESTTIALLREAVAVLASSPARLELLRTLADIGEALLRAGRPQDAREPLREALGLAHELGATVLKERAAAALVAAGARPRRVAAAGAGALTPSERRIARLAALGLTNRQIGEEAVVVPKTVQFHLTNVYRKLGISGRDELADALDAAPPPV